MKAILTLLAIGLLITTIGCNFGGTETPQAQATTPATPQARQTPASAANTPAAAATKPSAPAQGTAAALGTTQKPALGPTDVLLDYKRDGGIAGFCDHLVIMGDGKYTYEAACRKQTAQGSFAGNPTLDNLVNIASGVSDTRYTNQDNPGKADNLKTDFALKGLGSGTANQNQINQVNQIAGELTVQAGAVAAQGGAVATPAKPPAATPAASPVITGATTGAGSFTGQLGYIQDGDLYLARFGQAAGAPQSRRLTQGGKATSPRLSPDGKKIIFQQDAIPAQGQTVPTNWTLWVMGLDGGQAKKLIDQSQLPVSDGKDEKGNAVKYPNLPYNVVWLPDNQNVLITTYAAGANGLVINDDLWVLDTDSGTLSQVSKAGQGGVQSISPDGKRILLVTPTTIFVADVDSGNRHKLLDFPNVPTYSEFTWYPNPVWSADSQSIFVAIGDPNWKPPASAYTLYKIAVAGNAAPQKLGTVTAWFNSINWSPDGSRIVFSKALPEKDNAQQVVTATGPAWQPTTIADGEAWAISFAPDSKHFTYFSPSGLFLSDGSKTPKRIGDAGLEVEWLNKDSFDYLEAGEKTALHQYTADGKLVTIWSSTAPMQEYDLQLKNK
ncbi:MAG: PD40 domain-containing protein [Chloroflexi bacterium]|nr:PD40 domain-containing protein [Chloroflexota bacterium]